MTAGLIFPAVSPSPYNPNNRPKERESAKGEEAGSEWLQTGKCPIARIYRAIHGFLPLVALTKVFTPRAGIKYECPPAIVAARAALARSPMMKALRPQTLPVRILTIGALGLALNIPMGVLREHCVKFSAQWFLIVHASVPFIAMIRKAALLPKHSMAVTIATSIVGQAIGAKLEKRRLLASGASEPKHGLTPLSPPKKAPTAVQSTGCKSPTGDGRERRLRRRKGAANEEVLAMAEVTGGFQSIPSSIERVCDAEFNTPSPKKTSLSSSRRWSSGSEGGGSNPAVAIV
eukprot:TRINITY_DN6083_c0_g1_i2.p1 TRINITY_DN6083_c0_g1~~TRINITY_DN6083_c0_g1_i2.p1  ORF type:complete len:289 (-),score=36.89 TRINITY_DN6083_c0_g1_i2:264-1130(-)